MIWQRRAVIFHSIYSSHDIKVHKNNSYQLGINKQFTPNKFVKNKTLTIRS